MLCESFCIHSINLGFVSHSCLHSGVARLGEEVRRAEPPLPGLLAGLTTPRLHRPLRIPHKAQGSLIVDVHSHHYYIPDTILMILSHAWRRLKTRILLNVHQFNKWLVYRVDGVDVPQEMERN